MKHERYDISLTNYMALPGLIPGVRFNSEKSLQSIIDCVSIVTGIPIEKIISSRRKRELVQARQFISYLARKHTNLSLVTIGAAIGKKDHTTVIHQVNTCQDLMETDRKYKKQLLYIENQLTS